MRGCGALQLAGAAPEAQARALAQLRDGLATQRKDNAPAGATKELHSAVSKLGKVRLQPEPGGAGANPPPPPASSAGSSQSALPACTALSELVRRVLWQSDCGSEMFSQYLIIVLLGCIPQQDSRLMALLVPLILSSKFCCLLRGHISYVTSSLSSGFLGPFHTSTEHRFREYMK